MLTIFNRKELITTMDMQRQSNIRSVLSANGIAYTVRTENLQGSSALGGRSRGSTGSFGIDPNYSYEYHIQDFVSGKPVVLHGRTSTLKNNA